MRNGHESTRNGHESTRNEQGITRNNDDNAINSLIRRIKAIKKSFEMYIINLRLIQIQQQTGNKGSNKLNTSV